MKGPGRHTSLLSSTLPSSSWASTALPPLYICLAPDPLFHLDPDLPPSATVIVQLSSTSCHVHVWILRRTRMSARHRLLIMHNLNTIQPSIALFSPPSQKTSLFPQEAQYQPVPLMLHFPLAKRSNSVLETFLQHRYLDIPTQIVQNDT